MIGLKQEFWWGGGVSRNQRDVGMKTTTFFFVNIWIYKHLSEKEGVQKILQTWCGLPELIEIY